MNSPAQRIERYLPILSALALSVTLVPVILWTHPPDTSNGAWDSFDYKSFADNPFAGTTPPFGYRPLSPFVVYLLPLSIPTGFILLTAVSTILAAVVIFSISRHSGLGDWEALTAVPLFLFHGGTLWLLNAPCHVDAVGTFLCAIMIWSLVQGYVGLAAPALMLGVLNKESALFLLPTYWAARWPEERRRLRLVDCISVTAAALFLFWAIRYLWYPNTLDALSFQGVKHEYGFFDFYRSELARLWDTLGQSRLLDPHTYTFGFASLCGLAILGVAGSSRVLRCGLLLFPLVALQLIVATGDLRLKHLVLPVLIPLILRGAVNPFAGNRWGRISALGFTCVAAVVLPDSIVVGILLLLIGLGCKLIIQRSR